eukprot:NODE_1641_length_812_cov_110.076016_g1277_i0.p1 GENE.NODE_1641_length_812_cov_110.076016_g1277_i0~~NODE_1641_length_812_cov_110.076016_g1277_i0.p1  ORF type:complete len:244 (-),score=53.69 NODE_1641_length_812_cov_110.076016_g1277_i0:51-782(-)
MGGIECTDVMPIEGRSESSDSASSSGSSSGSSSSDSSSNSSSDSDSASETEEKRKPAARPAVSAAASASSSSTPSNRLKRSAALTDDEENLLTRCKRLRRTLLITQGNIERAKAEEEAALAQGVGDPMKDYKPKRPPFLAFPSDVQKKIRSIKEQITKTESDMRVKDDTKTVSLGTSKVNYIDPRIVSAFCKRHQVPIEKIFSATLVKKFPWALDISQEYRFDRSLDTSETQPAMDSESEDSD